MIGALDLILSLVVVGLAAAFVLRRFYPRAKPSPEIAVGDSLQRALDKVEGRRA